jgi:hypothetical protein
MNEEEIEEDKPIQESNKLPAQEYNKSPVQEPKHREENILQQDNVPISDSSKAGLQEREMRTGRDNEGSIPIDSSDRMVSQQQPDRSNFIQPYAIRQENDNEASIPIDSSERMVGQQQPDRSSNLPQYQPDRSSNLPQYQPTQVDQSKNYEAARTDSPYGSKLSPQETQKGGARYNAYGASV